MSKEAEILRKCVSCHDEKSRGVMYHSCVSLSKRFLCDLRLAIIGPSEAKTDLMAR